MKLNKKKVLVVALAVALVAIISMGTLAWFTDNDTVNNNFMVTDSLTDADALFNIDLYETKVNPDGTVVKDAEGNDVIENSGNTYDDILPGDVLAKDPTIKNTGKYDQWARVKVTLTKANEWLALFNKYNTDADPDNDIVLERDLFSGYNGSVWQSEGNDAPVVVNNTLTFTYYLKDKLSVNETATLFTEVKIPSVFTKEDMVTVNEFELDIVAEAIQYENTKDTCKAAFELVGM